MNQNGSRILLGDAEGLLHLVTLSIIDNRVDALCFIGLGSVSVSLESWQIFKGRLICYIDLYAIMFSIPG